MNVSDSLEFPELNPEVQGLYMYIGVKIRGAPPS